MHIAHAPVLSFFDHLFQVPEVFSGEMGHASGSSHKTCCLDLQVYLYGSLYENPLLLPAKNKQLHNFRNKLTVTNIVPSNSLEHIQLFSEHVSGTMLTFMNRSISASGKTPACFSLLASSASRAT